MLETLNHYCHGYVVVPVAVACRERGVFDLVRRRPGISVREMVESLGANEGHLRTALRVFESLGWIVRRGGSLRAGARLDEEGEISDEAPTLLRLPIESALRGEHEGPLLGPWVARSSERWGARSPRAADFLDGVLVIRLLTALRRAGILGALREGPDPLISRLSSPAREDVARLFSTLGWLEEGGGHRRYTEVGRFMVDRTPTMGVLSAYTPMLSRMPEVLFGDPRPVFSRDATGRERHLDRALNVTGSGFQHERYFAEMEEIVVSVFDGPAEARPRAIVDMGCGDGTLLRRLYEAIRSRSTLGPALEERPLTLVGVDFNEEALEATARTLRDLPHVVLKGDITDPARLCEDLRARGVDPDTVLHVRSFLDHDRPFQPPRDAAGVERHRQLPATSLAVASDGSLIPARVVRQSLVEHLERWAGVASRHGLVALEVHCLPPRVVRSFLSVTESLHFDAYHAFSLQQLVEARDFVLAAAEAGLFAPRDQLRRYPRALPFTRITLSRLERRDHRVRAAVPQDVPTLVELEKAAWPEGLQVSGEEIGRRVLESPGHQLVLEKDGRIVAALYSQRIGRLEAVSTASHDQAGRLREKGGPIVHLLGLCVHPDAQALGLADELLELALACSEVEPGVTAVAGVTRCHAFDEGSGVPLEEYIRLRSEDGQLVDPLLRFHESHGAVVQGLVLAYRPSDVQNKGTGVLVTYDLTDRGSRTEKPRQPRALPPPSTPAVPSVSRLVERTVVRVLGPRRAEAYADDGPLMEMGLDSMDLTEVQSILGRRLRLDLEPTLFFRHRTPRAVATHLEQRLAEARPRGSARSEIQEAAPAPPAPSTERTRQTAPSARQDAPAEAIAIVGLACRFASAGSAEEYWAFVRDGRDAVPAGAPPRWDWLRWEGSPSGRAIRRAGFLDQVEWFDAAFFGISPREARGMDPQQRLLLETAWHALEDAAVDPRSLAGRPAGVFVGVASHDYELLQVRSRGVAAFDAHFATGNAPAVAAGRLSYAFRLQGPALTVDTACSSSLVAVHLASQSLRQGESEVALAGGVNVLLAPEMSHVYAQARMLSASGRCRTFDASADGYVRAEGCGVVVLKRLQDALADGDHVRAVLRGSAINQDGPSNGLTAPNGEAQEAVIRRALSEAGVSPGEVDYVEAHGTGTPLGDPIEVAALGRTYGPGRSAARPLVISTAKTTIGHAEAAAGIAGLIKTVLALEHERIPPHLHLRKLNPLVKLESIPAVVPVEGRPWPRQAGRRRQAGVSSFGFSGTNAHAILEEPPPSPSHKSGADRPAHLLVVSARSQGALRSLTSAYAAFLEQRSDLSAGDVCFTAGSGRAALEHRLAVVGPSADELAYALRRATAERTAGDSAPPAPVGETSAPDVVFLFSGQGAQYAHMGRELYETDSHFRGWLEECASLLEGVLPVPLLRVLFPPEGEPTVCETALLQPAMFALEYALARLWESWGIRPVAVMGHSLGEYVAACTAGVMTLEEGLRLVATRGRLMSGLPEKGAMLAVAAPLQRVVPAIDGRAGNLALACHNAPQSVVVSGREAAIADLQEHLEGEGCRTRRLRVSHAFHSPLMDPILEAFGEEVAQIRLRPPRLPLVSNVTGRVAGEEVTRPAYWTDQLRRTVRFAEGMATLRASGHGTFLEIGPGTTLLGLGQMAVGDGTGTWLPSLRRGESDWKTLLESLGALFERGATVDWSALDRDHRRRRVALPRYPFERQRFWFDDEAAATGDVTPAPETASGPPVVAEYYDALSTAQEGTELRYLNFAPFPEVVPGFSWVLALGLPQRHSAELQMFVEAQQEMRRILFRHVDWERASRVLDIGCGYGSDLLDLARRHPHLRLCGFTLSDRQVSVARRQADEDGVSDRVEIVRKDSARDDFPPDNDVVFGFEVAHHIRDKTALFSNVGHHLREGGHLLLADFVSTADFAIEHPATSSFFPTRGEWIELLSGSGLECVECVDLSPEVAHSLHDPAFEEHLETVLRAGGDPRVREAFRSYDQLGRLLQKGMALYVLVTARRRSGLPVEELRRRNRAALASPRPFSAVSRAGACYEMAWRLSDRPSSPAPPAPTATPRRWALLEDGGGLGAELADLLEGRGESCLRVRSSRGDGGAEVLRDALVSGLRGTAPVTDVVHLWSLDAGTNESLGPEVLEEAGWLGCGSLLHVTQVVTEASSGPRPRLWVVTRGAHAAGEPPAPVQLASATIPGFVRTLRLEHPEIPVRHVDLDPEDARASARTALAEMEGGDEPEVALRGTTRLVPRLVRRRPPAPVEPALRNDAIYLVTGGLGALGLSVARVLVEGGARHLALVSRGEPSGEVEAPIRDLESAGCRVVVHRADVSRREDVEGLFAALRDAFPPLRGVVHAAGVLDDAVLRDLDEDRLRRVMAPKVEGAWLLHEATRELELDFFCAFSSVASLLGSAGQAHYAAANAFLDALAHHRQRLGLPGLSVEWGPWEAVGMAARMTPERREKMVGRGFGWLSADESLGVLRDVLETKAPQMGVFPMDWARYVAALPERQVPPLLSEVVAPGMFPSTTDEAPGILEEVARAPVARRREILSDYIRLEVAKVLGSYSAATVDPTRGFWTMGMDSLMSLELRNRLQVGLRRPLPTTLTLDHPNVEALVDRLGRDLGVDGTTAPVATPAETPPRSDLDRLSESETEARLLNKLDELEY